MAFAVIALGGAGTVWCGLVGARACGITDRRCVAAFLPYQLMIALAAWLGLVDLVRRPYHWHKTAHGEAALAASSGPASCSGFGPPGDGGRGNDRARTGQAER